MPADANYDPSQHHSEGITGEIGRLIKFDLNLLDESFKKEFLECIRERGTFRVIMDERILPDGEFGAYAQAID